MLGSEESVSWFLGGKRRPLLLKTFAVWPPSLHAAPSHSCMEPAPLPECLRCFLSSRGQGWGLPPRLRDSSHLTQPSQLSRDPVLDL